MAWVTDEPPMRADLDSCVACGLCLPTCPTYRLTGDEAHSPRGRIVAISVVDDGRAEVDDRFDEVTGFCLQCRACETACPSLVPYGRIIEAARAEAVAVRGADPATRLVRGRLIGVRWLVRVVSIIVAVLQRLRVLSVLPSVGAASSGLRRIPLPVRTASGGAWGARGTKTAALFVGCVADAWFSDTHRATIDVLVAAGFRVEALPGQTCCGALAAHGGLATDASRFADRNLAAFRAADLIVADVAGCGAHLKEYGRYGEEGAILAGKVRDVCEVVAEAIERGDLPTLPANGQSVAIQDPCHLEHGQRITAQPREIVAAAGFAVVDVDPGGLCCGAAGVYQLEHVEASGELGARKAAAVRATGATIVASANAGCEMQLRRYLDAGYDIRHPIEIYADALRARSSA